MRKLGTALHIASSGQLIVRGTKAIPLSTPVFTKKNQQIGFIKDVFGPVAYPYIAIAVKDRQQAQSLVGSVLYYSSQKRTSNRPSRRSVKR